MKRTVLYGLTVVLILLGVSYTVLSQKPSQTAFNKATQLNADTIFNLVNKERVELGLQPLVRDELLDTSSSAKCSDMLQDNYFTHEDPVTGDIWGYIKSVKSYEFAGENLGTTDVNENAVVTAWMNSETHRANIVNGVYKYSGITTCYSPNYTESGQTNIWLVVQHFTD